MTLKFSLLGCLTIRPWSGYDLAKLFDETITHFWSASHSQIYRTLNQMLQDGLVTYDRVEQTDHPDKKVYSITETGRDELRGWLAQPHELIVVRHEFLVQLTFANLLTDADALRVMQQYRDKLRSRLAAYDRAAPHPIYAYAHSERERFFWSLSGKVGQSSIEAELRWIEAAIAEFQRLTAGGAPE